MSAGGSPTGVAADPAIAIDGLVKRYGDRTVLDGVSMSMSEIAFRAAPRAASFFPASAPECRVFPGT